jgi:molybdopterin-guanine dinucleotide biosynthesis protein A
MSTKISGVILAGGLGRRMGGVDKGLQELSGKAMAQWAIERLRPQVDELFINANQNLDTYARYGLPVYPDVVGGFAGPLAGLHVALSKAVHPLVATVPCDSPFLPGDLVRRLAAALDHDGSDLAVARTEGQVHPVFCLCGRVLLPHLAAFLDGGGRKVDLWYSTLKVSIVDFDDEATAFSNINTPDELAQHAQRTR